VWDVRAVVASRIICDPHGGHGRHADEVIEEVKRFCVEGEEVEEEEKDGGGVEARATGVDRGSMGRRPMAIMDGAVTALDACARARALKDIVDRRYAADHHDSAGCGGGRWCSMKRLDCIRTGSNHLDGLLAPDDAYNSFDDGWGMPRPYKLPSSSHCYGGSSFEDDERCYVASDNPSSSNLGCRGVPFGMVTEFSGPPSSGKTQLAVCIAAHAVIENGLRVFYISGGGCGRKALSRRLYAMFVELARRSSSSTAIDDDDPTAAAAMRGGDGVHSNRTKVEEVQTILNKAMDRVDVAYVRDAHSLLATLARIDHDEEARRRVVDAENAAEGEENNGTLLVIDSVSGCLGHHLSSDAGVALVSQVALALRHMARTHDGRLLKVGAVTGAFRPRRFAVVLTNGSVAKRSLESEVTGSSSTKSLVGGGQSQNKPAMGRYWHASDVGIWLETDESSARYDRPINFHDNSRVIGLSFAEYKAVHATLQNHYGKSCKGIFDGKRFSKSFAEFRIHSGGIADV
jgi:hypothetical protein